MFRQLDGGRRAPLTTYTHAVPAGCHGLQGKFESESKQTAIQGMLGNGSLVGHTEHSLTLSAQVESPQVTWPATVPRWKDTGKLVQEAQTMQGNAWSKRVSPHLSKLAVGPTMRPWSAGKAVPEPPLAGSKAHNTYQCERKAAKLSQIPLRLDRHKVQASKGPPTCRSRSRSLRRSQRTSHRCT